MSLFSKRLLKGSPPEKPFLLSPAQTLFVVNAGSDLFFPSPELVLVYRCSALREPVFKVLNRAVARPNSSTAREVRSTRRYQGSSHTFFFPARDLPVCFRITIMGRSMYVVVGQIETSFSAGLFFPTFFLSPRVKSKPSLTRRGFAS